MAETDHGLEGFLNLQKDSLAIRQHRLLPDPVSLKTKRKVLPFVMEREPRWRDLSLQSLEKHCASFEIKGCRNRDQMVKALTAKSETFVELYPDPDWRKEAELHAPK